MTYRRTPGVAAPAKAGLANYRGYAPVCQRASGPISSLNATLLGGTSRLFFPLTNQAKTYATVLPVYENYFAATDAPNPNAVTVAAAVEDGGTVIPFTFGGQHAPSIAAGATAIPDLPITVTAASATYATNVGTGTVKGVWIRTYVNIASGNYPVNCTLGYVTTGEVNGESTAGAADLTLPGSATPTTGAGALSYAFGPRAILGPATGAKLWAAFGDSIANGQGDTPNHHGYIDRAAVASGVPILKIGRPGEFMQTFAISADRPRRVSYFAGVTDALLAYGVNDLNNKGRTPAQLKTDLASAAAALVDSGVRVHGVTITPRTTSTDSWVTAGNQTASGSGGTVDAADSADVNDWLRALPANFTGCFDLASYVSSSVNSGKWGLISAVAITSDGVHPTYRAHSAVAAGLVSYIAAY